MFLVLEEGAGAPGHVGVVTDEVYFDHVEERVVLD